jgi:hypothetical protein
MMIAGHAAVSADALVKTGPGAVVGVVLTAADAVDGSLILYDGLSATGTVLLTLKAAKLTSASFTPVAPWPFSVGCYADITGTGVTATVIYL